MVDCLGFCFYLLWVCVAGVVTSMVFILMLVIMVIFESVVLLILLWIVCSG